MMSCERVLFSGLSVFLSGSSPPAVEDGPAAIPPAVSMDWIAAKNGGVILVSGQAAAGKAVRFQFRSRGST